MDRYIDKYKEIQSRLRLLSDISNDNLSLYNKMFTEEKKWWTYLHAHTHTRYTIFSNSILDR